jgi:enterochelin esterase-like enzyme
MKPTVLAILAVLSCGEASGRDTAPSAVPLTQRLDWVTPAVAAPRLQQRTFESAAAQTKVSYHIYTPEVYDTESTRRFPVLYWLHGSGGGLPGIAPLVAHFDSAIRAGRTPPMLVVFVNGLVNGMYCNWKDGSAPLETVIIEELIPHVDAEFRTLATREGRIIEGFSMGGYGAARLGFKYPDLFATVSILGGGPLQPDFTQTPRAGPREREHILQTVFGGDLEYFRAQSPWHIAETNAAQLRSGLRVRQVIGDRDETLRFNREFHEHLTRLEIPHDYRELPGIGHQPMAVLKALDQEWQFYNTASATDYDPLALPEAKPPHPLDLTVQDTARAREIPVRFYLPAQTNAAPVVLFSHGLGGNREGSSFLGRHWAARGYVAVFLQHPGSDDSIWKDEPLLQRSRAMRSAASAKNFGLRVQDVPAVLDQLTEWNGETGHPLAGRLDLRRVGMSGHSFGAVTTQAVSGQAWFGGRQPYTDARIGAAIVFSPSAPQLGTAASAFGRVNIPWLLMTGTRDIARLGGETIGASDMAERLAVYPALPAGSKYELVLHEAEHSAFTDRALPGESGRRNPNHHRAILALSTAFWDAYLKEDAAARAWLDGGGPRSVLEEQDRWQNK